MNSNDIDEGSEFGVSGRLWGYEDKSGFSSLGMVEE